VRGFGSSFCVRLAGILGSREPDAFLHAGGRPRGLLMLDGLDTPLGGYSTNMGRSMLIE
jgi:hypothetical protein